MAEIERRVFWRLDGSRYTIEVLLGIRVARKLARRFDAAEVREER